MLFLAVWSNLPPDKFLSDVFQLKRSSPLYQDRCQQGASLVTGFPLKKLHCDCSTAVITFHAESVPERLFGHGSVQMLLCKSQDTPQARLQPGKEDKNCSAAHVLLGGFRLGTPVVYCCWKRLLFRGNFFAISSSRRDLMASQFC